MKRRIILAIAISILGTSGWGQNVNSDPAPAFGTELPYTEVLAPPMPVTGLHRALAFSSETPRSNFLMGSLKFGVGYDDNVFSTPSDHISDVSYLVLPSIDFAQSRGRWNWDFGYSPGFTINQRVSQRDETAQNLHLLMAYRLSPHVTAQLRENFEKTSSLFSGLLDSSPAAGYGSLQQPNTSVITPLANRTGNTTGLDLTYQLSASALVGASGDFYFVNYDVPTESSTPSTGLIDSRSWAGNGFYARRFSNRHWAGVTYTFQRLLFNPGDKADVSRTLFFYSISTGSHVTLSVWAGPEQAMTSLPSSTSSFAGAAGSQTRWDVAGGAALSWEGRRTSFRAGYTRQTTDGGGLAQVVQLQQVDGELKQRLNKRWTATAGLGYAKNNPLSATGSGYSPYRSWLGSAGFNCHLTDNLGFDLTYGRDQLRYEYATPPVVSSYRNRAWFSISYSFVRPLGR